MGTLEVSQLCDNFFQLPVVWSGSRTVYFGEFNNSGLGSNTTGRVKYARILTAREADLYTQISWINGSQWLPENDFDDEGCDSDADSNMELHFDLFTK